MPKKTVKIPWKCTKCGKITLSVRQPQNCSCGNNDICQFVLVKIVKKKFEWKIDPTPKILKEVKTKND